MRNLGIIAVVAFLFIEGCVSTQFEKLKPISQSDVYKVVAEVKRQIGVYTAYQRSSLGYPAVLANSRAKVCGNGLIGFDIVSVKWNCFQHQRAL